VENDSFLNLIEGNKSEDLTTAILAYVLSSDGYRPYRKLFFREVLGLPVLRSHTYEVSSQVNLPDYGKPDIVISGPTEIIVIENKFFAEFSQGDQVKRYVEYLVNDSAFTEKRLILLTVKSRAPYLLNKIREQLLCDDINHHLEEKGIRFETLHWEEILSLFQSNDFLVSGMGRATLTI
jgi:PD-(D/E)XK nuclease superfamily protein